MTHIRKIQIIDRYMPLSNVNAVKRTKKINGSQANLFIYSFTKRKK
jgi:hypothetical protein